MLDLLTAPIAERLAAELGVAPGAVAGLLGAPAKGVAADLALPCFQFAKARKVAPPVLAAELAAGLAARPIPGVVAAAAGPFLNVQVAPVAVARAVLPALVADPLAVLRSAVGAGRTVCIDFSSPNIAKHLAFHHIRGTMLGNALAHAYEAAGWRVVRINFLGDWGTAFGRLIAGWKREGLTVELLQAAPDQVGFLNDLYVRTSTAAKGDPGLEEASRTESKRLEDGDPEARRLWELFRAVSKAEFDRLYARLGVRFDSWKGEAYYADKMGPVLDELAAKGLTSIDQGATVVDLSAQGFKKPVLIKRADGGSLYATRDLAACDDRFREYGFARSLYVVDLGQSLHFKEWFGIAKVLGRPYAGQLHHVGYGLVLMWNDEAADGAAPGWAKARTRNGQVMMLRDVMDEAVERARAVVAEKNPELPADEQARVADAVGLGAVVFNTLKTGRTNDIKFKFEEALAMQGETGPYLQFAYARLCSIERKGAEAVVAVAGDVAAQAGLLTLEAEKGVMLALAALRGALERVVEGDEPSVLAQQLLAVAGAVAGWLTAGNQEVALRVLCPDAAVSAARLRLVGAARAALGEGLRLLGLVAPERM
jgi:arginyl-tRNA synthetase